MPASIPLRHGGTPGQTGAAGLCQAVPSRAQERLPGWCRRALYSFRDRVAGKVDELGESRRIRSRRAAKRRMDHRVLRLQEHARARRAQAAVRHARLMHSTCRWSVPQQPPSTLICGCRCRRSRYWPPSSMGSPASRSGASFSSWWLRLEALARMPRMRLVHSSFSGSASSGGNTARQPAAVPDRNGGLRRRASSQSQASGAWSRCPTPVRQ
jgi:hypothetical protein